MAILFYYSSFIKCMKRIVSLVSIVFFCYAADAQNSNTLKYSNIPVVKNMDSLQQNMPHTNEALIKQLLTISKSGVNLGYKIDFGLFSKTDSLCGLENNTDALFISKLLKTIIDVKTGLNKDKGINDCYKLVDHFKLVNDTTALLTTYNLLVFLNTKGIDTVSSTKKLLLRYLDESKKLSNPSASDEDKLLTLMIEQYIDIIIFNGTNDKKIFDKAMALISNNKNLDYYSYWIISRYASSLFITKNDAKQSLELYRKLEDSLRIAPKSLCNALNYYNTCCVYNWTGQAQPSKLIIEKALTILNNDFPYCIDLIWKCKIMLANNLFFLRDYSNAWITRNKADSIWKYKLQLERESEFRELQEKYQYDKKEQENGQLKETQKLYKIGVAIALVLLTIILWLFVKTRQQNQKLNELVLFRDKIQTIISHDFRSPLFALQSLYEQANYFIEKKDLTQLKKLSNNIDETSNRMGSLLKNLLTWAESSKTSSKRKTNINLYTETNDTIALYKNIIQNKNITIRNNINEELLVSANANVFDLLVRNWLDNLLKYANANTIQITASQNNNTTIISIIDNGTINADKKAQIQQQLLSKDENVSDETSTGLGLGLMVYFAKQEGWQLNLKTTDNKNEFAISIPIG